MKCKELKELNRLSSKLAKKIMKTGDPNVKLRKNHKRLKELSIKYSNMMHQFING